MQAPKCGPAAQYPSGLCQSGQCPHREASASCCRPHREPQIRPVNCPGQNYAATLGGTAQIQFVYSHYKSSSITCCIPALVRERELELITVPGGIRAYLQKVWAQYHHTASTMQQQRLQQRKIKDTNWRKHHD